MAAELILGAAGAGLGAAIPGVGSQLGFSIGVTLAGILFPPDLGTVENGKLNDIRLQTSTVGAPIPKVWGRDRLSGNIIDASSVKEHVVVTYQGGGGSGGGGQQTETFHYNQDFAILICEGPVNILRIFANKEVIYDNTTGTPVWSSKVDTANFNIYSGTTSQTPDWILEAIHGVGNVPAYKGWAYIVVKDFNLDPFGGSPPNFEFDIESSDDATGENIANWICEKCGLSPSEYDFSPMSSASFTGFTVPSNIEARSVLDVLSTGLLYDFIEADGKITCISRKNTIVRATIEYGDIGVTLSSHNRSASDGFNPKRIQEVELPRAVQVNYKSVNQDFQSFSQPAYRSGVQSNDFKTFAIDAVMPDSYARNLAYAWLFASSAERNTRDFSLSWKYLFLTPGDLININTPLGYKLHRITDISIGVLGPLSVKCVTCNPSVYTQNVQPALPNTTLGTVNGFSPPLDILLDINAIRDNDAMHATVYAACSSDSQGWYGGVFNIVPTSVGAIGTLGGSSSPFNFKSGSTMGLCLSVLPDGPTGVWDNVSTVDIEMTLGTLTGATEEEVLNGANMMVVGEEIISFKTVTVIGANTYRLSELLRGRRGTEYATGIHVSNEVAVLVNSTSSSFSTAYDVTPRVVSYQFYERNKTYSSAPSTQTVIYKAASRLPFSPCHLNILRDGSNNATISWVRRSRFVAAADLVDYVDCPLDEPVEQYKVEIFTDGSYSTIKRVITVTSASSTVYSAATQVTDFGSIQSTIYFKVYQYGRDASLGRFDGYGRPAIGAL